MGCVRRHALVDFLYIGCGKAELARSSPRFSSLAPAFRSGKRKREGRTTSANNFSFEPLACRLRINRAPKSIARRRPSHIWLIQLDLLHQTAHNSCITAHTEVIRAIAGQESRRRFHPWARQKHPVNSHYRKVLSERPAPAIGMQDGILGRFPGWQCGPRPNQTLAAVARSALHTAHCSG
jgi:hypothetical protein